MIALFSGKYRREDLVFLEDLLMGFEDFRIECNQDCVVCPSKRACDDMARFYNYVLRKLEE